MALKRKICIFMHRFDGGGAEKMTVILANALYELGYDVTFCMRYAYGETFRLLNPNITVLDMKLSEKSKIKKNVKNILYLRKLLRDKKYDILLSITAEMSQVAAMATWLNMQRIPLVAVIHNTLSLETHSFQKIRERLFSVVNKRMDGVITVSDGVRDDYIHICKANPNKVFTIYNPVISEEVFRLAEIPTRHPWLSVDRNWTTLVLAGRLSEQKNHKLMFKALKILEEFGDFRLILLGIGELEGELKNLCKEMNLEQKIDFYGYVSNPYSFFSEADAVVLSSSYEGLPTVLIEALACSSRIISTNCPSGPDEILCGGKYGYLVSTDNAEALAEGIMKALANEPPKELLKKRALDFSVEKSVKRYIDILELIIQKSKEPIKHGKGVGNK